MTLLNQHLADIRHSYLYEHLDEPSFEYVTAHAKVIQLATGERLFAEGESSQYFYLIHRGIMKLFKSSPDGTERIVELVNAKQLFGEDAMFVGEHAVYADALEPTQLIAFECAAFTTLMHQNAELCFRMLTEMSRRSKKLIDEIGKLTLQGAIQRVAEYLIEVGKYSDFSSTIRVNLPKYIIASRIGVSPETLSRIITKFRHKGMIDCNKDSIMLKNLPHLQQVANGQVGLNS
ncbi:MAG: Crp/Fnr family transcriptional regulator [Sulfuricella sp.]|nr:Crp/Fnr family transcriptional regulator [Sulfuricella sp.]